MSSTIELPSTVRVSLSASAVADLLVRKEAHHGPALETAFAELQPGERLDALILAFETLESHVRAEGVTPWSAALLKAMDELANRFLRVSPDERIAVPHKSTAQRSPTP